MNQKNCNKCDGSGVIETKVGVNKTLVFEPCKCKEKAEIVVSRSMPFNKHDMKLKSNKCQTTTN